jgi:hypothetical protein
VWWHIGKIVLIVVGAIALLGFAFLLGRKWRKGYEGAKALRQSLEADLKSESEANADLRAQLSNVAVASGNTTHLHIGAGVHVPELHDTGRQPNGVALGAVPCALCGGSHRGFDCGEGAIDVGGHRLTLGELLSGLDVGGVTGPRGDDLGLIRDDARSGFASSTSEVPRSEVVEGEVVEESDAT